MEENEEKNNGIDNNGGSKKKAEVGELRRKNAGLRRKLVAMEGAFGEEAKRNKKVIRELKSQILDVEKDRNGEVRNGGSERG